VRPTGRAPGWETLREALYYEIHWAFYRNAPIVTLGVYWGAWVGVALAAIQAAANPAWRKGLSTPGTAAALLLRAALAVISSLCFLRTQNLWLAILLHWGVTAGLRTHYQVPLSIEPQESAAET
jgi:membrane protease YdiL (CAAX protease family)